MTYAKTIAKTIAIAAGLAGGAVLLSGTATTHEGGERFAIATAGDGAWRVDTYTGRMVWCETTTPPETRLSAPSVMASRSTKSSLGP